MLAQPRRLLSTGIAIALAVAFVAASLLLGDALNQTMRATAAGPIGGASVVVRGGDRSAPALTPALVDELRAVPGVTQVKPQIVAHLSGQRDGRSLILTGHGVPALSEKTTLVAGRLPSAPGEVVVNERARDGQQMEIGTTMALSGESPTPFQVTVVGVLRAGSDATATPGAPELYGTDADALAWAGGRYAAAYVFGPPTILDAARAIPGFEAAGLLAEPAASVIDERVADLTRGTAVMVGLLLGFAGVAVFVSALVIANTFSILVAQRTRQLALLRCVGASARQVFGLVLREALLVALVASALGVALGYGFAWLAVALSQGHDVELTGVPVTPTALLIPAAVGVLITLLSALAPARTATRISPMAALRVGQLSESRRPGSLRIVLGTLLLLTGGAALVAGAFFGLPDDDSTNGLPHSLMLGMAGGLVSFVGLLLFSTVLVPATARVLTPLAARLGGVSGELAAENAVRNPKRAAATASALLVGVTLITMMSTAASCGQATAISEVEGKYPMDAILAGTQQPVTTKTLDAVRAVAGVERAVLVPSGVVQAHGLKVALNGLDPRDAAVLQRPDIVAGLGDGEVSVPARWGVPTGADVALEVTGSDGSKTVTLRARATERRSSDLYVTPTTLATMAPATHPQLWVRFADGTDPTKAGAEIGRAAAAVTPGVSLGGAAEARAEYQKIIDIVLGVVVGLLAIAVVIALVGITNTLSLSVLERRQESGLLRALGFTRTQLRRMVGLEAALIACVATVLGLLIGLGYGIAGTHALLGTESKIILDVPWLRLALVAVVAIAAGWLASVVPAVRGSRVSPAAALATE